MITLTDYQVRAHETAQTKIDDPVKALVYHVLNLNGDAGRASNAVTVSMKHKPDRDKESPDNMVLDMAVQVLYNELGHALWHIAEICTTMDWKLSELARANLANRKQMVEEAGKVEEKQEGGKW